MSFISAIPIIGELFDKSLDIIDKRIEDKDLANQLKTEIGKLKMESELEMEKIELEREKIEMDDAKDKRGLLKKVMDRKALPISEFFYVYLLIIIFNHVLSPILISFGVSVPSLTIPSELTSIINTMTVSFFGYKATKKGIDTYNSK